jgi:methylphosphotriester-DNA--protein-cysteine methyltransferase
MSGRVYRLMGRDGAVFDSAVRGMLGGNGKARIYGRLDCPSALAAVARGGYQDTRVFFADEPTAIAAGFRPCGNCMRDAYAKWKAAQVPVS